MLSAMVQAEDNNESDFSANDGPDSPNNDKDTDDSGVPNIADGGRRKSSRPKKSVSFAVNTLELSDDVNSTKEDMQGFIDDQVWHVCTITCICFKMYVLEVYNCTVCYGI